MEDWFVVRDGAGERVCQCPARAACVMVQHKHIFHVYQLQGEGIPPSWVWAVSSANGRQICRSEYVYPSRQAARKGMYEFIGRFNAVGAYVRPFYADPAPRRIQVRHEHGKS